MSNDDEKPNKVGKLWSRVEFQEYGETYDEEADEEHVREDDYDAHPGYGEDVELKNIAYPSMTFSRTIELVGYNSAKVSVGVTLPCHVSELEEGFDAAEEMTLSRLNRWVDRITGGDDDEKADGPDDPKW